MARISHFMIQAETVERARHISSAFPGGKITMPETDIPGAERMAMIQDSGGNRVGIWKPAQKSAVTSCTQQVLCQFQKKAWSTVASVPGSGKMLRVSHNRNHPTPGKTRKTSGIFTAIISPGLHNKTVRDNTGIIHTAKN